MTERSYLGFWSGGGKKMDIKSILPGGLPVIAPATVANRTDVEAAPAAVPALAPAAVLSVRTQEIAAGVLVAAAGTPSEGEMADRELLDALKQRIQAGDFEIDYGSLSRSLVENAVMAIGSGTGSPR